MYEILWNGQPVGKASINQEGLYYRINCSCHLPEKGIFRVLVSDGDNTYDLGICVPDGNANTCVTRISRKRFNGNNLKFVLSDRKIGVPIPVMTGKPFKYLDKLNTARLRCANGQLEIIIDTIPDQQDNGRNLKHQRR